ncbi:MAG: BamA/TamA family outer membrane protein [Flavobacterium sp.]
MDIRHFKYFTILFLFFIMGCGGTKHLAEGELLYTGGSVKVIDTVIKNKDRKNLQKELEELLRPKPNSQFLGMRPKLFFYNLAGEPRKDKGFRYWLRNKVGQPPVLFSKVDLEYNSDLLRNYAENKGFFKTKTSADSTRHGKKATAKYTVWTAKQYKIKSVVFPEDSSALAKSITKTKKRSLLVPGEPYDLDVIKKERERIDTRLKEKGYFYFQPDYILAKVDSIKGNHEVNIKLEVKDETPEKARKAYTINQVTIYPNFSIQKDSLDLKKEKIVKYHDFTIIDSANTFNPKIFDRTVYLKKGELYSKKNHNLTLNRFINLGTFKFVKNEFKISDSIPNALDVYYYLTLLPKKFIRSEFKASVNSASYTGFDVNVNWNNRNLFRGAELLTISAFGGTDFQISSKNEGYNIYTLGSDASLVWPRFIAPFHVEGINGLVQKTKAAIGYERQTRSQLYTLNSFTTSFGYLWKENVRKEHQLKVMDVNLVSPRNVTDLYLQEIEEDPSLAKVVEKQLIFGSAYSYTYTNTMHKRKKHTFYFNGELDLAGNIAGLVTGANAKKGDTIKFFNVPFSQYTKLTGDLRHYLKLGKNSKLASRLIVGAGFSYGNATEMPYTKQYVVGGPNSIRAFRSQSVGPGSYQSPADAPFLPDESGDIKLEFNTEYRAKLFSIVHSAVFLDAGNIWLLNENPDKPSAQISENFIKEIAVGVGTGLRLDFSFLILRTDLAFPIKLPYQVDGNYWVADKINFGSSFWRKENLILHIAIGYPF